MNLVCFQVSVLMYRHLSLGMSDDFMRCYLTTHREVLEEYVMTFIDIDTLARWMEKKVKLSDDLKKQGLLLW